MAEVLIGFRRPESMSEAAMRSWMESRVAARRPVIALGASNDAEPDGVLRMTVTGHEDGAAEDQIADLMLDMRLLGLRPTVVSGPGVRPLRTPQ
jgi:hypothetical protein